MWEIRELERVALSLKVNLLDGQLRQSQSRTFF